MCFFVYVYVYFLALDMYVHVQYQPENMKNAQNGIGLSWIDSRSRNTLCICMNVAYSCKGDVAQ